jgi:predicted hotdog family 3-hydroxylacyl-ACP dehydratase
MHPAALIPHVGDAILIDEIRETGQADQLSARLTVRPGTAFSAEDESLPGWIGVEILAQLISAFATLRDGRPEGPAKIGLLLGVREYRCAWDRFPVGMQLDAEIIESMSDGQALGVFDGTLTSEGVVVAEGIVSACRLTDPEAFLLGAQL